MSGRKGKPKGESSKDHTPSKSIKPSKAKATTGDGSDIGNKKKKEKKKTSKESDSDDAEEPTSPQQTLKADKQKADKKKKKKTVKESDSDSEEETESGSSSPEPEVAISESSEEEDSESGSNSFESEVAISESSEVEDCDDLDDSVTAMSLQDQSKGEHTWTDWTFAGLNVNSLLAYNKRVKIKAVKQLIAFGKLDILVIGESWMNNKKSAKHLKIKNFSYVRFDRTNGAAAGGLIIYIRTNIQFTVTSFCEWSGKELNVQYVELAITYPFRFDLVAIYSPPYAPARRLVQRLMDAFLKRSSEKPVMFIGDLNIARERNGRNLDPVPVIQHLNLDKDKSRKVGKLFEQFRQHYGARALITDPTCNSKTSTPSCVDHIITNIPTDTDVKVTDSGVVGIPQNISDHNLIWCRVDRTPVPTAPDTAQSKNYLLSQNNDQWQMTEIDRKGTRVGDAVDLSSRAVFINTHIEETNKPTDKSKVKCAVNGCAAKFDTYDSADEHKHKAHFPCHLCFKVLKDYTVGREHMKNEHKLLMCTSPECNYLIFTKDADLVKHEGDCKNLNPTSKTTK